jgi:apolipoprotein N-acyltransferase
MTALRCLAAALIGVAMVYASFAFMAGAWNPSAWIPEMRGLFVFASWVVGGVFAGLPWVYSGDKS